MHGHVNMGIGWGTLSLINAGLAQSKGRSGLLWFLGSLLVGPLATFLIVVLPPAWSVEAHVATWRAPASAGSYKRGDPFPDL